MELDSAPAAQGSSPMSTSWLLVNGDVAGVPILAVCPRAGLREILNPNTHADRLRVIHEVGDGFSAPSATT